MVHHFNRVRSDNGNGNLVICEDQKYHMLLHQRARAYKATGCATARKCQFCDQWGIDLKISPNGASARHLACHAEYMRIRNRTKTRIRLTDPRFADLIGDLDALPIGIRFLIQHSDLNLVRLNKAFKIVPLHEQFTLEDDFTRLPVAISARNVAAISRQKELSTKLCECGCGERTRLILKNTVTRGLVKGEGRRYIFNHAIRVHNPRRK